MTAAPSLVPSPAQRRAEFGIGASEAAAAIGVSDYKRPIDVWLEKTARREPFAGNEKTFWGLALEPVIRAHYIEKHAVSVFVPPTSLFHRELPFVRATPDGIVLDDAGKWVYVGPQVKNVGLRMEHAWEDDAGKRMTPMDYYVQGVVEMAVTNLPRIDFAVLLGGQQYFEVTLGRDAGLEADILEQLAKFQALVDADRQPELDDSESFRAHLLKQIKSKAVVDASPADVATLERWREVAVQIKQLKREESGLKNQIAATLAGADANRMKSPLGVIAVGASKKKTSWKMVATQLGGALPTLAMVERELEALQAASREFGEFAQRIEHLRAQLQLTNTLADYDTVVLKHTTIGAPTLNRPRSWTKDVDGDDDNNDEG